MHEEFKECVRCIMSKSSDKSITFDTNGVCNHCLRYDELVESRIFSGQKGQQKLNELVAKIKKSGKGKKYDCIVGVSGGVDSTYVAYLSKKLGLRPLAIHFDNGWNSNLAVVNIEKTLSLLGIDLDTYVIDWDEFKDLQLSFLRASVPDGEIPTDHGIDAVLWQKAAQHGIKYILSGMNFATESLSVPDWAYGHSDWRYIKDIHKKFGHVKLKTFPHFGFFRLGYDNIIRQTRIVSLLNYVDYNKSEAMDLLQRELGWTYYGGKHYESIYTRFFQGYVLPNKFGIDKRVGHCSDLINSGQMTRKEALDEVSRSGYDPDLLSTDMDFVKKKLNLNDEEWDAIMAAPVKSFRDYKNSYRFVQFLRKSVNMLRAIGLYPK